MPHNTDIPPNAEPLATALENLPAEKSALISQAREMLDAWEKDEWTDSDRNFLNFLIWLQAQVTHIVCSSHAATLS